MIIIFIGLSIIFYYLLKKDYIKNIYLKTIFKCLMVSLLVASILEVTIFNFRHYESLMFKGTNDLIHYNLSEGIECTDVCRIVDKENAYIEIYNIDKKMDNLYLDFKSNDLLFMDYEVAFTDEANKLYVTSEERHYVSDILSSHYIKINPSGRVGNLKINILNSNGNFKIDKIMINKEVPLLINNLRLIMVLLFIFLIFLINPKNNLYNLKHDFKKSSLITLVIIGILSGILCFSTLLNSKSYNDTQTSQYSQYKNLAKSLSKGKFYLDLKVSDKLLDLDNPYDTNYRDIILRRYKDYYWDYSYYNGKYYSYFGIVPCLLTYLPCHLITHSDLPNYLAMSIGLIFLISVSFYFMKQILTKYFPKASYMWYVILSIFFLVSSGLITFAGEPTFYNMPIVYGLSFSLLGLSFWLKATMKDLDSKYLGLGSLCMALVAGCRPQLLLGSFFAIPLFWDYVFKKRELFSKKSIKETFWLCFPYIIVASLLMYYNYSRFGSIFDFGANYNLTTNDMTKRGFRFDRIFTGLYYFLLAPGQIILKFPFIKALPEELVLSGVSTFEPLNISYVGVTIYESMYGGFLFINLICILGLFFYKFKKQINNKELFSLCFIAVISSLLIIIADTEMAGILPRYLADFGWLLSLSTVIVILSLLKNKKLSLEIKKLLITFIVISIVYNLLTFFLHKDTFSNYSILGYIYYQIYYLFMFWL